MQTDLVHLDRAQREIALAIDLPEVKAIYDKIETLRVYLKKVGAGLEIQNRGAEIALRAMRRGGQFLAEIEREPGRRTDTSCHDGTRYQTILKDSKMAERTGARWQTVWRIPEPAFESEIAEPTNPSGELTMAGMLRLAKCLKLGVHFSSRSGEWLTPQDIIDRVVCLFGTIDLDPCSNDSELPNVPARRHFTREHDGLSHPWHGRVYMNPPYGRQISEWVSHLVREYRAGRVTEAIALVPARTDTAWFREFKEFPRCFIHGRLRFSAHENRAPFPSMVVYLGENTRRFAHVFGDIGDSYTLWIP